MPIRPPQKKCAIFTVWTIRNKPEIISNSAAHTKKLGASMRKKVSRMLNSGGQVPTEMQNRWKLSGISLLVCNYINVDVGFLFSYLGLSKWHHGRERNFDPL